MIATPDNPPRAKLARAGGVTWGRSRLTTWVSGRSYGRVSKPHGLDGEVSVIALTDRLERFANPMGGVFLPRGRPWRAGHKPSGPSGASSPDAGGGRRPLSGGEPQGRGAADPA